MTRWRARESGIGNRDWGIAGATAWCRCVGARLRAMGRWRESAIARKRAPTERCANKQTQQACAVQFAEAPRRASGDTIPPTLLPSSWRTAYPVRLIVPVQNT
ncbi:hypothetical protein E1J28_19325 [Xanthomonas hortorum pv. vitians]|nr:hypothetical protein [Xanthomonas hortorum pv. vitians]NMI26925.1 hypothetical protein [Xanthomonas hortorum pv. vitians]NMI32942.1 hypothetical protein [Xanthomonas hortorum pv. vitians]NMI35612.1 hypothetical protein [Xanthomonas hortorum pv. vitians]QEW16818.1 hypothetical protein DYQ48_19470 [Xanthomonas hortorum]